MLHEVFFFWIMRESLDISKFERMIVSDHDRAKVFCGFMIRPICVRAFKIAYVETFVHSNLPISRLSCFQKYLCPEFCAFIFLSKPRNFRITAPHWCVQFTLRINFRSRNGYDYVCDISEKTDKI